ncbi:hypothetical protein EDB85DRAFT_2150059 [Lactarius pseudohatsudake]|nr:hypothetical protein EDB85DRAFT_2150059 [Lactarius pseudohatsudake]
MAAATAKVTTRASPKRYPSRPSLDDLHVPTISHKASRDKPISRWDVLTPLQELLPPVRGRRASLLVMSNAHFLFLDVSDRPQDISRGLELQRGGARGQASRTASRRRFPSHGPPRQHGHVHQGRAARSHRHEHDGDEFGSVGAAVQGTGTASCRLKRSDWLHAKVDEIQALVLLRRANAFTSQLKMSDVTIEGQWERLLELEKPNREINRLLYPRASDTPTSSSLTLQAQTNEPELKEFRRVSERTKVLESERAALQRHHKE